MVEFFKSSSLPLWMNSKKNFSHIFIVVVRFNNNLMKYLSNEMKYKTVIYAIYVLCVCVYVSGVCVLYGHSFIVVVVIGIIYTCIYCECLHSSYSQQLVLNNFFFIHIFNQEKKYTKFPMIILLWWWMSLLLLLLFFFSFLDSNNRICPIYVNIFFCNQLDDDDTQDDHQDNNVQMQKKCVE